VLRRMLFEHRRTGFDGVRFASQTRSNRSQEARKKADLAASLWVVAVAAIGPLPASSGSKPFSMCRNH
jgi:hypothetical protein